MDSVLCTFSCVAVSFCSLGATSGESPADIASKNKLIVTMLPSSPNVTTVYTGTNGILRFLYFNALHMNSLAHLIAKNIRVGIYLYLYTFLQLGYTLFLMSADLLYSRDRKVIVLINFC